MTSKKKEDAKIYWLLTKSILSVRENMSMVGAYIYIYIF